MKQISLFFSSSAQKGLGRGHGAWVDTLSHHGIHNDVDVVLDVKELGRNVDEVEEEDHNEGLLDVRVETLI